MRKREGLGTCEIICGGTLLIRKNDTTLLEGRGLELNLRPLHIGRQVTGGSRNSSRGGGGGGGRSRTDYIFAQNGKKGKKKIIIEKPFIPIRGEGKRKMGTETKEFLTCIPHQKKNYVCEV